MLQEMQNGVGSRGNQIERKTLVSTRVPAHSYFALGLVSLFFALMAFHYSYSVVGALLIAISFVVVPTFAYRDRIQFDGKRLKRVGILFRYWKGMSGSRFWLRLKDVEEVETSAVPTYRFGAKTVYRYRTTIRGRGVELTVTSRRRDYREFVKQVLAELPRNILDNASFDLLEYFPEPRDTKMNAALSRIPSADVLENVFRDFNIGRANGSKNFDLEPTAEQSAKIGSLRRLANELKLCGSYLQSLETFRRASLIKPPDAWLLYEFACCLRSFAYSENNNRLEKKALALMKLSELRAGNDGELLARVGESYFNWGDSRRSLLAFQKAVAAVGEQFRSVRGLAEIALRDGKIAHVIHNFSAASRLAETPAIKRWSDREVEYFQRLNQDDDYLEMELGRIGIVDSLDRWRRIFLRVIFAGLVLVAVGLIFDDFLANAGWAISGVAVFIWCATIIGKHAFASRIRPDLLDQD